MNDVIQSHQKKIMKVDKTMRKIEQIVIHCSASTFGNVKKIRSWHLERGWRDIGYHYVICNGKVNKNDNVGDYVRDGAIEDGRDVKIAGAHARGHNAKSIGICLIGTDNFTNAQMEALRTLVLDLAKTHDIKKENIFGHNKVSPKSCPNFNVEQFVKNIMP